MATAVTESGSCFKNSTLSAVPATTRIFVIDGCPSFQITSGGNHLTVFDVSLTVADKYSGKHIHIFDIHFPQGGKYDCFSGAADVLTIPTGVDADLYCKRFPSLCQYDPDALASRIVKDDDKIGFCGIV